MSQENVEVVRAAFAATRRRDRQAFRSLYHPDIQWDDPSALWGDWGTRRGVDDIEDAFRTWFETFDEAAVSSLIG